MMDIESWHLSAVGKSGALNKGNMWIVDSVNKVVDPSEAILENLREIEGVFSINLVSGIKKAQQIETVRVYEKRISPEGWKEFVRLSKLET
jgi:hypothetical protein